MIFDRIFDNADRILATPPSSDGSQTIGSSREGRPMRAWKLGRGDRRVSVIGGCHADEPVGPRMLSHLAPYLASLPSDDPLLSEFEWWIVPHVNPDGEALNGSWYADDDRRYNLLKYLELVVRELPGDDIEFGFPEGTGDTGARAENRALYDWWNDGRSFALHVSFHGMGFAAGPWFLIEEGWRERVGSLKKRCTDSVAAMGYELHDVERNGEKGFVRLGRGFCTRPDSGNMKKHFLALGDEETASKFRPSSMETIRSFGGDPLTLVSEMPLFILPGVGADLGPPDPVAVEWKTRLDDWRVRARAERHDPELADELDQSGIRPMPVRDQMKLQLAFLGAGLQEVSR